MHRPFLPCLMLAACLPAIPEERPGAMLEEPPAPEGGGEPHLVGRVLDAVSTIGAKIVASLDRGGIDRAEAEAIRAEALEQLRGVAAGVNPIQFIGDVVEWVDDHLGRDAEELRAAAVKHAAKGHAKRAAKLLARAKALSAGAIVRAKFAVRSVEGDGENGGTVYLNPVYSGSPENEQFYRYTPGGSIELSTVNPTAYKRFAPGQEFYVDFTPAPSQA